MVRAIKDFVTIQPGGVIELHRSDLPAGTVAEIIVMIPDSGGEVGPLAALAGRGVSCFSSAAEVDAFLRAERDAWDR